MGTARAQDAGARWRRHEPGTRWQWQLSSRVGTPRNVDAYDVDGSDTGEQTVNCLHANGSKAICYMSVGSWENRKPDENKFPNEALGNDYDGWPGERWLDIRQIGVLAPIMGARMYVRKRKGFDAAEPDNMGGCINKTGFDLTAADQLRTTRGGTKPPTRGGSPSPPRTPRTWRAPSRIASTLRSSRTASTRADANR
jgi:hypothetical protein